MIVVKKQFILYIKSFILIILSFHFFSSCAYVVRQVVKFKDLPPPQGVYSVGSKIYTWTDESRDESFTSDLGDKRRIVVQVWYPIKKRPINKMPYLDNYKLRIQPIADQFSQLGVSSKIISLILADVKNVKTNTEYNAPIDSNSSNHFPLIIFSHGLGGMKNQNSIQIEELVSNGYVVIAPDHAFDANITIFDNNDIAPFKASEYNPNAKYTIEDFYAYRIPQIQTRSKDLSFIINQIQDKQKKSDEELWNIINLDKIGVFGHSFGGGTSILTSYNDNRVDAAVALDGWIEPIPNKVVDLGINKPFLYIGRTEWEDTLNYYKLDKLIENSNAKGKGIILSDTEHFDYTDTPYFNDITKKIKVSGDMPSKEIVDTLNYYLTTFFNKHLKEN